MISFADAVSVLDSHMISIAARWRKRSHCCVQLTGLEENLNQVHIPHSMDTSLSASVAVVAKAKSCDKPLSLIVAMEHATKGIGWQNKIPFDVKEDKVFFKRITMGRTESSVIQNPMARNAVVMGWRTWQSLQCKALPDRLNVVVCSTYRHRLLPKEVQGFCSFESAIDALCEDCSVDRIFAIGGTNIYAAALGCTLLTDLYVTEVTLLDASSEDGLLESQKYDTFFPWRMFEDMLSTGQFTVLEEAKPFVYKPCASSVSVTSPPGASTQTALQQQQAYVASFTHYCRVKSS